MSFFFHVHLYNPVSSKDFPDKPQSLGELKPPPQCYCIALNRTRFVSFIVSLAPKVIEGELHVSESFVLLIFSLQCGIQLVWMYV